MLSIYTGVTFVKFTGTSHYNGIKKFICLIYVVLFLKHVIAGQPSVNERCRTRVINAAW